MQKDKPRGMAPGPVPGQVKTIPVMDEYITKHFVFEMATDGSAEPKQVGEWLTTQSLSGFELAYKEIAFLNGHLHIYIAMKRLKERKLATPPGVINTKSIQVMAQ
jgi:hypothetical protein